MIFSIGFFSKMIPNSDRHKKDQLINLDKSFWPCPMWLGNQIGLAILIGRMIDEMIDYLISK